jgi:hypothetical protein
MDSVTSWRCLSTRSRETITSLSSLMPRRLFSRYKGNKEANTTATSILVYGHSYNEDPIVRIHVHNLRFKLICIPTSFSLSIDNIIVVHGYKILDHCHCSGTRSKPIHQKRPRKIPNTEIPKKYSLPNPTYRPIPSGTAELQTDMADGNTSSYKTMQISNHNHRKIQDPKSPSIPNQPDKRMLDSPYDYT